MNSDRFTTYDVWYTSQWEGKVYYFAVQVKAISKIHAEKIAEFLMDKDRFHLSHVRDAGLA